MAPVVVEMTASSNTVGSLDMGRTHRTTATKQWDQDSGCKVLGLKEALEEMKLRRRVWLRSCCGWLLQWQVS